MSSFRIGEMVKDALMVAGCDAGMVDALDEDATVQIDFESAPTIYIGENGGRPVIWSDVCEFHPSLIKARGDRFLEEVMRGVDFATSGHIVMREQEGNLQIFAEISEEYTAQPEMMAQAIDEFVSRLVSITEIAKQ